MIKYSIVTINYKTAERVKALWQSLATNLEADDFEFILLDNNSGDDQVKTLETFFDPKPQAHFIPMKKNLGFGAGYAEAIRFAQGEYLVLINPDVEILPNCLIRLSEALEADGKAGIMAPQLQNPDSSLQGNARQFPTLWNLIKRRLGIKQPPLEAGPVPWVQGSFMLMRRRFFSDVLRGFDPHFFLFFEDTDLCRRTWLAGFKVILVDEARAMHSDERLSGHDIFRSMWRKTFWIHFSSMCKYFWKYRFKKTPTTY